MSHQAFIAVVGLGVLFACAPSASDFYEEPTAAELRDAYREAIEDAHTADAHDIYRNLVAVTEYDDRITWKGEPGSSAVLVATWTNTAFASLEVSGKLLLSEEIWVTVATELESFCSTINQSGNRLSLRIAQLLGLPPDPGYDRVAEFWVEPDDLFRPCPDPETTDSQCELHFPEPRNLIKVDSSHIAWIDQNSEASYSENGYPWTRLGYTYDWGNPDSNIGLSEFVVRPRSTVQLERDTTTEAYCR